MHARDGQTRTSDTIFSLHPEPIGFSEATWSSFEGIRGGDVTVAPNARHCVEVRVIVVVVSKEMWPAARVRRGASHVHTGYDAVAHC